MSINGSYVLEKNENLEDFLKACGAKDERIQKMTSAKPKLEVTLSGDKLTLHITGGAEDVTNVISLGSPSTISLAGGLELSVTLNMSGNKGKGTIQKGQKSGEIVVDFGASHLTETFSFGDLTCKRIYKRL